MLDHLPMISQRLKQTTILYGPALNIIRHYNQTDTLLYLDPPYLPETRRSTKVYDFEMTKDDHINLCDTLKTFKGKILISGYPSPLYNEFFKDWNRSERLVANHASQMKIKQYKQEMAWKNY